MLVFTLLDDDDAQGKGTSAVTRDKKKRKKDTMKDKREVLRCNLSQREAANIFDVQRRTFRSSWLCGTLAATSVTCGCVMTYFTTELDRIACLFTLYTPSSLLWQTCSSV